MKVIGIILSLLKIILTIKYLHSLVKKIHIINNKFNNQKHNKIDKIDHNKKDKRI